MRRSRAALGDALAAARARLPDYLNLLRRICSRGRRVTQWPQSDNALAIHGKSAPALPLIDVVADVLYVGSDGIMTSAGSAAGIDLCLHLVREDFGIEAANTVARRLVVSPHRDGAQAQQVVRARGPGAGKSAPGAGV